MTAFTWRDGERTIRFGRGAIDDAGSLLGTGYTLLTTARAGELREGAADVVIVPSGLVDEIAGDLLGSLPGEGLLVALGGGRVIDTAKALGAATGRPVAAVPTTLSAAEMTKVHRQARGATPTAGVRPQIVINDPALCASQPLDQLAASAANALAHAVEAPTTTLASPVPTLAAREATRLIAGAFGGDGEPDRDALALAALLSGYAIDANWYGLSHVCSQTLVRVGGAPHGPANAAVLPYTAARLRERAPAELAALDAAAGRTVESLAAELAERTGTPRIRDLGVAESVLDACAEAAAGRPELHITPPPADAAEIRGIYASAY